MEVGGAETGFPEDHPRPAVNQQTPTPPAAMRRSGEAQTRDRKSSDERLTAESNS